MKLLLCSRRRLLAPAVAAALVLLPSAPADAVAFVPSQARLSSNKNTIRPPSVVTSMQQLMKKPEAIDDEPESKVTTADFAATDEEAEKMEERRQFQEQAFESDENSPATIDAACAGSSMKKIGTPLEEKEDKKFDPMSLWTPHSQNF